jgi:alpha-N-arabinofuranosidase
MPVKWENGWPRMTRPGEAIPYTRKRPPLPATGKPFNTRRMTVREEFGAMPPGPEWMLMRNPRERWFMVGDGALQLTPRPVGLGDFGNPSFVARRQQHMYAAASTAVRFNPREGEKAGIAALQNDEYWLLLSVTRSNGRNEVRLERRAGPDDPASGHVVASAPLQLLSGAPVQLRIRARGPLYDFEYATRDGQWQTLKAGEDGRILSTKTAGGFVGAVFGLYAYAPRAGERG